MKTKLAATLIWLVILFAGQQRCLADDEETPSTNSVPYGDLANLGSVSESETQARQFNLPPPVPGGEPLPPDSPSTQTNFSGIGDNNFLWPPDTMGAVGPDHIMVMLNTQVRVQTRAGVNITTQTLSNWWSSVGGFSFVFDPRVEYDRFSQRWIAVAVSDANSASASLLIAVSQTSNPTNAWYRWRIDADPNNAAWLDYPRLGYNGSRIAVVGTWFNIVGGARNGSTLYVFDKASLYAGDEPVYLSNSGALYLGEAAFGVGMVPAVSFHTNIATTYLVQSWNGNFSGNGYLRIYAVDGTVTAPTIKTNAMPATTAVWTNNPTTANFGRQLGTTQRIHTGDDRIHSVIYRHSSLWCAHTVYLPAVTPTRSAIQWWELNPTNGTTIQRGRIQDGTGVTNYSYPSLAVNRFEDVLVGYSLYSSNIYPSAGYSFRACNDAAGAMQAPSLLRAGVSPYWKTHQLIANERNRWGDYSQTVVDPVNETDMWTIQEYAGQYVGTLTNGSGRWAVWWGKLAPVLPVNDNFVDRFTISGNQAATNGTTVRATRETGEPNHAGNANTPSVWYRWTAPANGTVTMNATNRGAGFSMALAVYTGNSVSTLTLRTNASGGAPRVVFTATSNTTYAIAVAGLNGACGDFTLNLLQPTPPAFVQHPESTNVVANASENLVMNSLAIGEPDPTYQWQFRATNSGATFSNISAATNATYTVVNVQTNHVGSYRNIASNSGGSATSIVATVFMHGDSAARLNLVGYNSTSFWYQIYGLTNRAYRVETTTNLNSPITWTPVFTNNVSYFYTNFARTNDLMRFYRAITNN